MDVLVADAIDAILGQHDNGDADGVLLVDPLIEGMMHLPIATNASGGPSLSGSTGTGSASGLATSQYDPGGANSGWSLTAGAVTAGVASNAYIERTLYGDRVGIGFRGSGTPDPFTIIVDGIPFSVRNTKQRRHAAATVSSTDYDRRVVISDLGPGPHTVRVLMEGAPIGGAARNVILLHWLVDRAAGYTEPKHAATLPQTAVTLTTTLTTIAPTSQNQRVQSMTFANNDASDRVVTIQVNAQNWRKVSVPTGKTVTVDFPSPLHINSALIMKWAIDSGSSVLAWLEEVN